MYRCQCNLPETKETVTIASIFRKWSITVRPKQQQIKVDSSSLYALNAAAPRSQQQDIIACHLRIYVSHLFAAGQISLFSIIYLIIIDKNYSLMITSISVLLDILHR